MCKHNSLKQYYWVDDFDGKELTLPAAGVPFIQTEFLENVIESTDEHAQFETILPFSNSPCYKALITSSKALVNASIDEDFKAVYEMTFQIQNGSLDYFPGDTIGVLSKNPHALVCDIIERDIGLKQKQNQNVLLKVNKVNGTTKKPPRFPVHLPTKQTTIYKILLESLDLHAIPKKTLIAALLKNDCIQNPNERRALEILCSREGAAVYTNEILQQQKSFYDLFKEFPSMRFTCKTINVLFENLPRLMPRPYSIVSSPLDKTNYLINQENPRNLKIIFSMNNPPGVTTGYLESMILKQDDLKSQNVAIDVYLRKSNNFRLSNSDFSNPIIMIATGTGIAPFLGFLEHRQQQMLPENCQTNDEKEKRPAESWLFFGCRKKTSQIYGEQLVKYMQSGSLSRLSEVFSRESNEIECTYVQHLIRKNATEFIQLFLKQNTDRKIHTKTFVCGNSKMAQEVQKTIEDCLADVTGCGETEAHTRLMEMKKDGQYIEDVWL